MTTHTITLARHTAQVVGLVGLVGVLVLGTWDSYGTEQLLLRPGPEWEGLAIDATFHNTPNDKGVTMLVDADGLVPVPPEACMRASKYATITFRGVQDGVQRISCNLPYVVLDHAQVPGANSTATPSENAQALAQMQDLRDGAVDAKRHAEAARDAAAKSAVAAKDSETNAGQSATAAKTAQSAAETAKAGAETAQKAAASSASSASTSASTATTQAAAANSSATAAKASEAAAEKSAKEAAASAANLDSAVNTATQKAAAASASAEAAKASESAAASSEAAARKYANSAELAAKTADEAAAEKLQQMQAIQDDVTAKQAQTATDATAAEKAKVAAEAAQNGAAASKVAAANSSAAAKTSEDAAAKSAADADSTANSIKESMTQIAALQKRQNVLVGSETGNPIAVDDAFAAPLCGTTVYGKSTQDGTPTPDAPVPIVSAGDGGSVAVKVTGANMLEGTKPGVQSTVYGITYTIDENGVLITGTATNDFSVLLHDDNKYRLTHGIYYLTTKGLSPSTMLNFYFINKFSSDVQNQKVTLNRDVEFSLRLQISKGATLNTTVQVSLTRNKITSYSPYCEQLLTLPTPNGLPGIPVTSGGNYTDQNGQQWICDEVDLERGVKVQRVYKIDVDGENSKFEQNGNYANLSTRGIPIASYVGGQRIYAISTFTSLPWYYNTKNGQFLYLIAADISGQINESCKKQLGKVYYALATPIETPLTPAEIAAYKALISYAPDTVVQASDGAGVKLDYQRDVNLVVKNLEDAIASMTTT